jgi:hypothetical protein
LPLLLAAGGLVGLGGYVYLQRNPAVVNEAEAKIKGLQGEAKASKESPAAAGALIKQVIMLAFGDQQVLTVVGIHGRHSY